MGIGHAAFSSLEICDGDKSAIPVYKKIIAILIYEVWSATELETVTSWI